MNKSTLTPLLLLFATAACAADRIIATEDYQVKVTTVAGGLEVPWGMIFLDANRILLTEKPGRMRIVERGTLLPQPVRGVPPVRVVGQGGLLDGTTHPPF